MARKNIDEAANKVIRASQVIFKGQTDKALMPTHALLSTIITPESPHDYHRTLVLFFMLFYYALAIL